MFNKRRVHSGVVLISSGLNSRNLVYCILKVGFPIRFALVLSQ